MIWSHWFGNKNRGGLCHGKWRNKIRSLHQHMRGWAKNTTGTIKREKSQLTLMIDELD
jgi:hypothetical protein